MVDSPEKYPWSSFQYLLSAPNKDIPLWLNIQEFLKLCQTSSENFINFVKENSQKNDLGKTLQNVTKITSDQMQNKLPKNIENILKKVKEQIGDIETNKRLKHLLIYLLIKENYRIKDITNSLRITRQGALKIYKKMQKNLITDHIYQLWLNHIKINLFS